QLHVGILLHEMAHLSGGLGQQSAIVDIPAPTEAAFEAQPRVTRLINVTCYEVFGHELLINSADTSALYGGPSFARRLPLCTGGGRILAPPVPAAGPDPLAFPGGFA